VDFRIGFKGAAEGELFFRQEIEEMFRNQESTCKAISLAEKYKVMLISVCRDGPDPEL